MLSTICMMSISCYSRDCTDWYINGIVTSRPNIKNATSARASNSLFHEKKGFLILPVKRWEPLCAVCEVLVILIRKRALVKNAH